jgi:hypothetical protein
MAGDWIKMECTTPDKPEVIRMADLLDLDQDAVLGKLVRLWMWADLQSVDGNALRVTERALDRIVFCPGFAAALRQVGWLKGRDAALQLPNFDRHNGQSAKKRAETNRRVAKHRQKQRARNDDVTQPALQKALPEKRREDIKPPSPDGDVPPWQGETAAPPGNVRFDGKRWPKAVGPLFQALRPMLPEDVPDADLADVLRDWRQARAEKKRGKSWTQAQIDLQIAQLQQIPERERFAALRCAAVEGWQALMVRYWRERRERERQENPHIGQPARAARQPDQIPPDFWRWLRNEHGLDRANLKLPDGRKITEDQAWHAWGDDWRSEAGLALPPTRNQAN